MNMQFDHHSSHCRLNIKRYLLDQQKRIFTRLGLILTLMSLWVTQASGAINEPSLSGGEFLPVDEAFTFSQAVNNNGTLHLSWKIADGYYLYKSRIAVKSSDDLTFSELEFLTESDEKNDPYFGHQFVFHDMAEATLTYNSEKSGTVSIRYQGCASAGLCYPPQTRKVNIPPFTAINNEQRSNTTAKQTSTTVKTTTQSDIGALSDDAGLLATYLAEAPLLLIIGLFFLLGLGLTFTPCVLPMVPILSSIIVGQKEAATTQKSFMLSSSYVLGMSLTYSLLGAIVGLFGAKANLQAMLQNTVVLIVFSSLFAVLSLSMFGMFELQLPESIRSKLQHASDRSSGGQFLSVAMMGAISALVVSPCVSAPLAGALLYISTTGDVVLGSLSLLMMALGMGVPLILIGVFGNRFLPKSGAWMIRVKEFFGFLLLGVALSLLQRIIGSTISLLLWAILLISFGIWLGALSQPTQGWHTATKSLGIFGLIWGILLIVGAATGRGDLTHPLQGIAYAQVGDASTSQRVEFKKVTDLSSVLSSLESQKAQPILVDVYADWCISCKELDDKVFSHPSLMAYKDKFNFIKFDISDFSEAQQTYLSSQGIVGPPAVLIYTPTRPEKNSGKLMGEFRLEQLKNLLDTAS